MVVLLVACQATTRFSGLDARPPAAAALGPLDEVVERAEGVADAVLAAAADEQDARLADLLAAVRADPQAGVGIGAGDPPGLPVRALQRPRHDVLEPAEGRAALAHGLGGTEALVAIDVVAAPATGVHGARKRTLPCGRDRPVAHHRPGGRRDRPR